MVRSTFLLFIIVKSKGILQVLDEELINKHMITIVEMENSGVVHMLNNDRIQGTYFFGLFLNSCSLCSLQALVSARLVG